MWLRFCAGLRENATKPPDGRTPRVTANSTMSISPTQKPGTEMPSVMAAISGRVHQRPRCCASTRPSGTAISTASSERQRGQLEGHRQGGRQQGR